MWTIEPWQLLLAVAADLLIGDPRRFPHVTRIAGALATGLETVFARHLGRTVTSGFLFLLAICGALIGTCWVIHAGLTRLHPMAGALWSAFIVYQAVAAADLRRHVNGVFTALTKDRIDLARRAVGRIVGRDTHALDESGVSRAAAEAIAESSNDAALAPLFWAAIGGAGGALLFRVVNTLDSMVGHRDEQYECFGKAAARADDLLGLIPARLAALLSAAFYGFSRLPAIRREAARHASPNAGWPEAALAHALDLRLGGPNTYDGIPLSSPPFNPSGRPPAAADIPRALRWFAVVYGTAVAALTGLSVLFLLYS